MSVNWMKRKEQTKKDFSVLESLLESFQMEKPEDTFRYDVQFLDFPPRIYLVTNYYGAPRRSHVKLMMDTSVVLGKFCDEYDYDYKASDITPLAGYTKAREYLFTLKFKEL